MNNKNDFKDNVWCGIQRPHQEKIKKVKIKRDNYKQFY